MALVQVISPLKDIPFKEEFCKVIKEIVETQGGKGDDEKYETLYDFVNITSLDELKNRAVEAYKAFQSTMEPLNYNFNFIITTIQKQFDLINDIDEQILKQKELLDKKEKEINEVSATVAQMGKEVDNCDYSTPKHNGAIKINETKSGLIDKMVGQSLKAEELNAEFAAKYKEYIKLLNTKKKHQITLAESAPMIREKLSELDFKMEAFEKAYNNLQAIYSQCDILSESYSKYSASYTGFLMEINRRKQYEKEMEDEINECKKKLNGYYENEYQTRVLFRNTNQKNLPTLLQPIIKENPIKYEVYPTKSWSLTNKLSMN